MASTSSLLDAQVFSSHFLPFGIILPVANRKFLPKEVENVLPMFYQFTL